MGNVNFKVFKALILTVDLWSAADAKCAKDSFLFHLFCIKPGLMQACCLWFTLLMKCWQVCPTHTLCFNSPAGLNGYNNSFTKYQRSMKCHHTPCSTSTHSHTHTHICSPFPPAPVGCMKFAKCFFMPCKLALTLGSWKVWITRRALFGVWNIYYSQWAFVQPTSAPLAPYCCRKKGPVLRREQLFMHGDHASGEDSTRQKYTHQCHCVTNVLILWSIAGSLKSE